LLLVGLGIPTVVIDMMIPSKYVDRYDIFLYIK